MNLIHRWYCRSSPWKQKLENEILPWVFRGVDLGDNVLELGPGPGLTTDWLASRHKRITCLEVDRGLACALGNRTRRTGIRVQCGDATAMPFRDGTFSGLVALTMLHHVPSPELQDRLFAEACRVVRPGGAFAGTDGMPSFLMNVFHIADTMVLVDPATLPARLESAGFRNVTIETGEGRFRFSARRPAEVMAN